MLPADSQQIPLSCFSLPVPPSIGTTPNSLCGIKIKPSKEWQSNPTVYLYTHTHSVYLSYLCLIHGIFSSSLYEPITGADVNGSMTFHVCIVSHLTHYLTLLCTFAFNYVIAYNQNWILCWKHQEKYSHLKKIKVVCFSADDMFL